MTLLLQHWLGISPAVSGFILNSLCYIFGFRVLGRKFILYSVVSGFSFSAFYALFELFPRIYPEIAGMSLAAAVLGALFVGAGVGLCVRAGGAPSGDDALAMSIVKISGADIRIVYFLSDIIVLILSLTYIDIRKIVYSLLTVVLSGQLIGFVSTAGKKARLTSDKERGTAWRL